MTWGDYFRNIWTAIKTLGWAWSCVWNAVYFGDPNESVSGRVGRAILSGRFWRWLPVPQWLRKHFIKTAKEGF